METLTHDTESTPLSPSGADDRQLYREINERFRARILELDGRDICLFLPHCLRSRDCPAVSDDEGIHCRKCGRCSVGTLVAAAEESGVRVFCVPGGSLLEKIVQKHRPKAILGAACGKEIHLAVELFRGPEIPLQVFPLEKEGCFETRVRTEPIEELLSEIVKNQTIRQEERKMKADMQEGSGSPAQTENPTSNRFWSEVIPREFDTLSLSRLCGDTTYTYDTVGPSKTLSEPLWEFLSRGGKGKRTKLFSLILQAFGREESRYREFMLIPELSHNGTLIIDDIEDSSSHRRGKPCVHHLYGTDVAMNAGNALYFLPLMPIFQGAPEVPAARKNEVFQIYVQGMIRLHFGQSMDIAWHRGLLDVEEISEEKYLQMTGLKTGSLYWMSAGIAAVLADVGEEIAGKLQAFASSLGIAFQIKDDLLDIQGERFARGKGGLGKDITEGKITLMVIHALRNAPREDRDRLKEILALHTPEPDLIEEAIAILHRCDATEYAAVRAEQIVRAAWQQAEPLIPEGPVKGQIERFADSLLNRDL